MRQLREIPAENVFYLPWDPKAGTTDIDTFRKQILMPILRMIEDRHLGDQIDPPTFRIVRSLTKRLEASPPAGMIEPVRGRSSS